MIDILNSYLVQHKSISIPGLGTLYLEKSAAAFAANSRQLLPPSFSYRFDKFHDTPHKAFFLFLAGQKSIPEYEAINMYNEFAAAFRNDIRQNEEAAWKHAGVFRTDNQGEIIFEPFSKPFTSFAPVDATPILHTVEPEPADMPEEDHPASTPGFTDLPVQRNNLKRWWMVALALLIVGAAVLGVHFYHKGTGRPAFFNQQSVR